MIAQGQDLRAMRDRLVIFCSWFVIALLTQLFARAPGLWIAGLLAQLVLAVVLIVRQQMDDIY